MLKLIRCEFWKLKRKKLFWFSLLLAPLLPAAWSVLVANGSVNDALSALEVLALGCEDGYLVVIPLLAVLTANLVFIESDYDTLKNLRCIPVSYFALILAKLIVLLFWAFLFSLVKFLACIGLTMALGEPIDGAGQVFLQCLISTPAYYLAALPCAALVLLLNKNDIISLIITFFYTIGGFSLSINESVFSGKGLSIPQVLILRWQWPTNLTPSKLEEGSQMLALYKRMQPYFISAAECYAELFIIAAVCLCVAFFVCNRREL